jgi:hypothetical protein
MLRKKGSNARLEREIRQSTEVNGAIAIQPIEAQEAALNRLIAIAQKDTGQSRSVADFLLAWWNAESCGGFDHADLWGLDEEIAQDMVTVFAYIARANKYPDALGYGTEFQSIERGWRPELKD